MNRQLKTLVLLLALVAACKPVTEVATTPHPSASKAATDAVHASSTPGASPPAPAAPNLLRAPTTASDSLTGNITLDASYIVAQGGGNIQNSVLGAAQGGNVIVAGLNGIISQDGNGIISQDGNGIVAQGGGNIVAQGGGNIVAQGGGNLGPSVAFADDNSTIVAQGGGNLTQTQTANYHLAQAQAPVAPGTQLPAAGMGVSVVDLSTNCYLPLGVDAKGQAVYTIYSDSKGHYAVYLPKSRSGSLLVVASVPGSRSAALAYNVLSVVPGATRDVDELHAVVCAYTRGVFVAHVAQLIKDARSSSTSQCKSSEQDPNTKILDALTGNLLTNLYNILVQVPPGQEIPYTQVAARMADFALASVGSFDGDGGSPDGILPLTTLATNAQVIAWFTVALDQFDRAANTTLADPQKKLALQNFMARTILAINSEASNLPCTRQPSAMPTLAPANDPNLTRPSDFLINTLIGIGETDREPYIVQLFDQIGLTQGISPEPDQLTLLHELTNNKNNAKDFPLDPNEPALTRWVNIEATTNVLLANFLGTFADAAFQKQALHELTDALDLPAAASPSPH